MNMKKIILFIISIIILTGCNTESSCSSSVKDNVTEVALNGCNPREARLCYSDKGSIGVQLCLDNGKSYTPCNFNLNLTGIRININIDNK